MARLTEGPIEVHPLTEEERARLHDTLERIRVRREEMLAARGGKLFPPAEKEIRRMRRQ